MTIAHMRRDLEKLTILAKRHDAGSPLLPRKQWHPELRARHESWKREIAENGHDFIWYLSNSHRAPKLPPICFKPQYRHLVADVSVEAATEVYGLVKGTR